jgi:uncharacterized protein HemX
MTIAVIVSLIGVALAALLALFGAGVAWGTQKANFDAASLRIAKLEDHKTASNTDVLRAEILGLKTYLDTKFDEIDRRIDKLGG